MSSGNCLSIKSRNRQGMIKEKEKNGKDGKFSLSTCPDG